MAHFVPAKTGYSRVFLIDGGARPDHAPEFMSCLRAGGVEQAFGDITRIECPDPENYGGFIEVGNIQGAVERPTITLTGRYASDESSRLFDIARKRCEADIQVHFGACTDPGDFDVFTKSVVLEGARLSNWSTDDLGALASGDNAEINEMADASSSTLSEVSPLSYTVRGADVVVSELHDVVICSTVACGECDVEDTGCERIYSVAENVTGSPGTPVDVIFTEDGGATMETDNINALGAADTGDGIACLGTYIVVISHSGDTIAYKEKTLMGTVGGWTANATGIVAAGSPMAIWSVGDYAFIVGDGGYVYGLADPATGVTVIDAGAATAQDLKDVHAISEDFAIACGAAGAVIYTEDGVSWQATAAIPVAATLNCCWAKDEDHWWVGTAAGALYYTLDKGATWTQKTLPSQATFSVCMDIAFSSVSVGYVVGQTSLTKGRIYRTYNGGYTWVVMPESASGSTVPAADAYNAVAACVNDVNFMATVGLADDGTDGIFVIGQD